MDLQSSPKRDRRNAGQTMIIIYGAGVFFFRDSMIIILRAAKVCASITCCRFWYKLITSDRLRPAVYPRTDDIIDAADPDIR